ncbi:hypothetical protein U27_02621 [Candidatus Vecturithrix granuli]|uniref:Uncharacterized protein n=1 Tax=Vecturithrix granuli TaxID=1499967 RepID=A0A081CB33_VECG1|nr:hypothetical protein U27_02621 [Candidatus Vecturithrix granuli]
MKMVTVTMLDGTTYRIYVASDSYGMMYEFESATFATLNEAIRYIVREVHPKRSN